MRSARGAPHELVKGHFPTVLWNQAALKCLYLALMGLDSTGRGPRTLGHALESRTQRLQPRLRRTPDRRTKLNQPRSSYTVNLTPPAAMTARVGTMRVVIGGGHGQVARRLVQLLTARGDTVVGLIRNPAQVQDLEVLGAEAVVCDLEVARADELAAWLTGASAVVFAAGAGPGSGAARKDTVDRGASVLLADAAEQAKVRRFIQISSMGAGMPPQLDRGEVWVAYIAAKTSAEEDLRARDLDWTILRPGGLSDEPGTGLVTLAEPPLPHGWISRDDVASVLLKVLDEPGTRFRTLELVAGHTPIDEAVRAQTLHRL